MKKNIQKIMSAIFQNYFFLFFLYFSPILVTFAQNIKTAIL